ncbi:replication fork protection component Swi3, partial [Polyplosphaeria fusca]
NTDAHDDLDDLLNSIVDGQDVFDTSEKQTPQNAQTTQRKAQQPSDSALGLEEVKIVKARQPIPKLDENRLLSAAGVPKLQRISKERLRLKGKGHEYGDVARMLNMYQLWLDDLYPRAKFADGLAIIEKLGHTKRIQMMRKEWINEGRPRNDATAETEGGDSDGAGRNGEVQMDGEHTEAIERDLHNPEENPSSTHQPPAAPRDEPSDDELDALLAEEVVPTAAQPAVVLPKNLTAEDDMFADEADIMAEMEGMW